MGVAGRCYEQALGWSSTIVLFPRESVILKGGKLGRLQAWIELDTWISGAIWSMRAESMVDPNKRCGAFIHGVTQI